MQALQGLVEYPRLFTGLVSGSTVSISAYGVNGVDEGVGVTFQAPHSGSIDGICFSTQTVAGAVSDAWIRLHPVDSLGDPDESIVLASGSFAILSDDDYKWFGVDFDSGYNANMGEVLSAVVYNPSESVGNFNIYYYYNFTTSNFPKPIYTTNGTSWVDQGNYVSMFGIKMDGQYTYVDGIRPLAASGSAGNTYVPYSTSTSPSEVGIKLTMPFTARCVGFVSSQSLIQDYEYRLYYDSDTVLASGYFDKDYNQGTDHFIHTVYFDQNLDLDKDSVYRIAFRSINTTQNKMHCLSASGCYDAWPGGDKVEYTSRSSFGQAWNDDVRKRPEVGFLFSHISSSGGGGGLLTHPSMAGGMRG